MAAVQEGGFYVRQELSWHMGTGDSGVQDRLVLFLWGLGFFRSKVMRKQLCCMARLEVCLCSHSCWGLGKAKQNHTARTEQPLSICFPSIPRHSPDPCLPSHVLPCPALRSTRLRRADPFSPGFGEMGKILGKKRGWEEHGGG